MGQRSSTASVNTGATPIQGSGTQQQSEQSSNNSATNTNSRHRHRHRNASQSNQQVGNLSPRSRFRHEMSRRGYGTNPDIFLRLFQLQTAGQSSSNQNTRALNSDLSSDDDEANWNHNLSSLATSLPFFFGMRGTICFFFQ